MAREHRVMSALATSEVPVPGVVVFHHDEDGASGVGTDFYIMDFVEGRALRSREDNAGLSREDLAALGPRLVDVLARLHAVSPEAVGLEGFGRPAGFLERQVRRWRHQLDQSRSREVPALEALSDLIAAAIPDTQHVSIVHGDFRLDNTLVRSGPDGPEIAAVLDWEMSTLGDSLTDLGLLHVYWTIGDLPGAADSPLASAVDLSAGYSDAGMLTDAYASARGIPAPDMSWYTAMAGFKLAVVLEGIHYRHLHGQTVGEGFDAVGRLVPALAEQGLAALHAQGR
jgi:aminoglycoside phosphotransferase (APT) family kinase protein